MEGKLRAASIVVNRLRARLRRRKLGAVVVAQLGERSLPIPEVRGSNPVIGKKLYWTFTVNCNEKTKIKKKNPGKQEGDFSGFNTILTALYIFINCFKSGKATKRQIVCLLQWSSPIYYLLKITKLTELGRRCLLVSQHPYLPLSHLNGHKIESNKKLFV